ncbi:hypothetical protein CWE22_08740 [Pseudidiomarina aestuarii]|uniref:DUF2157 domain-containing protein n=1 Tax=Pseudidiomarina aestuarii TaxID=624146 RepID=A0A7Z6ZVM0_9GAMM|nr:hypothetical protein [Pseudidiomarina aestuarii]RUO42214.1 hypothetical protein CWE22_08740 [Pseudidiomarina aestuarii]
MYTEDDLSNAVREGVVPEATASAFRHYVEKNRSTSIADEEHFRLITGFNDIFVVIAAVLALAALWTLGNTAAPWLGGLFVLVAGWGMAEYFTRIRRMALPSIVFLGACLTGAFFGTLMSLMPVFSQEGPQAPLVAFIVAALVATAHWFRFQVPITLAAGIAAVIGVIMSLLAMTFAFSDTLLKGALFVSGLLVFALALKWDRSDLERQTRRSDVAFWLHLLAAPLLVHPIFSTLAQGDFSIGVTQALITIALYLVIGCVSLVIDRRALMVSALAYVIYVFSNVLNSFGIVDLGTAIIGLVIGTGLLLLSVFWHHVRAGLVNVLPQRLTLQLPPA